MLERTCEGLAKHLKSREAYLSVLGDLSIGKHI